MIANRNKMSSKVNKIIAPHQQVAVEYWEGDLANPRGTITAYVRQNDLINQDPYKEFRVQVEELQVFAAEHHWFDWTIGFKEHDTAEAVLVAGTMGWDEFVSQPEQMVCNALGQFIQSKYMQK